MHAHKNLWFMDVFDLSSPRCRKAGACESRFSGTVTTVCLVFPSLTRTTRLTAFEWGSTWSMLSGETWPRQSVWIAALWSICSHIHEFSDSCCLSMGLSLMYPPLGLPFIDSYLEFALCTCISWRSCFCLLPPPALALSSYFASLIPPCNLPH